MEVDEIILQEETGVCTGSSVHDSSNRPLQDGFEGLGKQERHFSSIWSKKKNLFSYLANRELGAASGRRSGMIERKDLGCCLPSLYHNSKRKFHKIWDMESTKEIDFAVNIHLNNFSEVYDFYGNQKYVLNTAPTADKATKKKWKIISLIGCEQFSNRLDSRNELFALTANSRLVRYVQATGECIQVILLSNQRKYKQILWASSSEQFFLISNPKQVSRPHPDHPNKQVKDKEFEITIFNVEPFGLFCRMVVSSENFTAAPNVKIGSIHVYEGILVVAFTNKITRYYDLNYLLKQYSLNVDVTLGSGEIPNTVCLPKAAVEKIPHVFETPVTEHNFIDFGGFPFHFITLQPGVANPSFIISEMMSRKCISKGRINHINTVTDFTDEPSCEFYDYCHRILYRHSKWLAVYRIEKASSNVDNASTTTSTSPPSPTSPNTINSTYSLVPEYMIDIRRPREHISNFDGCSPLSSSNQQPEEEAFSLNPSRKAKKKISHVWAEETIISYDYDGDMDLLVVLASNGFVYMYKNSTGEFVRQMKLPSFNIDTKTSTVIVWRNMLLHLSSFSSKTRVTTYEMY